MSRAPKRPLTPGAFLLPLCSAWRAHRAAACLAPPCAACFQPLADGVLPRTLVRKKPPWPLRSSRALLALLVSNTVEAQSVVVATSHIEAPTYFSCSSDIESTACDRALPSPRGRRRRHRGPLASFPAQEAEETPFSLFPQCPSAPSSCWVRCHCFLSRGGVAVERRLLGRRNQVQHGSTARHASCGCAVAARQAAAANALRSVQAAHPQRLRALPEPAPASRNAEWRHWLLRSAWPPRAVRHTRSTLSGRLGPRHGGPRR